MRKMFKKVTLIVVVLTLLFSCAQTGSPPIVLPQSQEALAAEITSVIAPEVKKAKSGAVTLLVVHGDDVVYRNAFGYKDQKSQTPADDHTTFRIGSISKLFTGIAIMQLVARGAVDIDKPLTTYIPEFFVKSRFKNDTPVTIRSIMTHHSGLSSDYLAFFTSGKEPENFQFLIDALKQEYKAYPTGEIFSYSNVATALLGEVIQRVSGQRYNDFLKENIFDPLGMKETSNNYDEAMKRLLATAYDSKNREVPYYVIGDFAAGSVMSNTLDMEKFISMLLGNGTYKGKEILPQKYFNEMLTIQNGSVPLDLGTNIGLNFFIDEPGYPQGGKNFGHGGYAPPYASYLIVFPEHKLGVFYSSSSDAINNSPSFSKAMNSVPELALAWVIGANPQKKPQENPSVIPVTADELAGLPRTYATMAGLMRLEYRNGALFLNTNTGTVKLYKLANGWYKANLLLLGFIELDGKKLGLPLFNFIKYNSIEYLAVGSSVEGDYRGNVIGLEYSPGPLPSDIQEQVGNYRLQQGQIDQALMSVILEGLDKLRISVQNGYLTASVANGMNLVLDYAGFVDNKHEFRIMGMGRYAMETIFVWKENGTWKARYSGFMYEQDK